MIKKLLATVLATVMLSVPSFAQGRIVGRVVDAGNGAGISDAGIQIVGTSIGSLSGVEGRFTVNNVPEGTVTITTTKYFSFRCKHCIVCTSSNRRCRTWVC
jgi:hypothetical protein